MNSVRPQYPFDASFYHDLVKRRPSFSAAEVHDVPAGRGYGLRVGAGHAFRFVMVEGAQIIDLDLFNADDPSEHLASGVQFNVEGGMVTRFTRIWGTPPLSRPLATVIADSVRAQPEPPGLRDHKSYGAHCNAHHWMLFTGRHPNTCYDNLREGCEMVGLGQRDIHNNLNLFQKSGMDPTTGLHITEASDAVRGDYIELYAEIPLLVVLSLCPYGDGAVAPDGWADADIPVHPVRIEVLETGVQPPGWSPSM